MSKPFDFGLNFKPAGERLKGERAVRLANAARALPYHVSFLDDVCKAILPNDLVLIGARTGAGKTELATRIAKMNARHGKRVHFFALEAFEGEIETRIKYDMIASLVFEGNLKVGARMSFSDWYLGRIDIPAEIEAQADAKLGELLATLKTYYRGSQFGMDELKRLFLAIQDETDLIVLDHLHYVDLGDERDGNRAMSEIVKAIRDVSLSMGKPVICVAHLKKRESRKTLVPDLEDFHGISDITKIATVVITLARARDRESANGVIGNTYIGVPKFRLDGACPLVACVEFDLRRKSYAKEYLLGRLDLVGEKWTPIPPAEIPWWANSAERPVVNRSHPYGPGGTE